MRDKKENPYPHKFQRTHRIDEFHKAYNEKCVENNVFIDTDIVAITGRVMSIRASGNKLVFIDLVGDEHKVQIFASADKYQGEFD